MSEVMKRYNESSESALSETEPLLRFFGVICVAGKQYAQVVPRAFRITMAVLYPDGLPDGGLVQLVVRLERTGDEFLLCVLKHGEIHQVNLNLIFSKEEEVLFQIKGMGRVCLTGYQIFDSEDALHDEGVISCPLREITTASRKKFKNMLMAESATSRSKMSKAEKKAMLQNKILDGPEWTSFINQSKAIDSEDDDDDESDEDFEIPLDENESEPSEEYISSDDDEDIDSDESEKEIAEKITKIKDAQSSMAKKRKQEMTNQPQKRSRGDNFNTSSGATITIDNDEDESDSDDIKNTSIGNTPMPKQQVSTESASSKKKRQKKKKKLSEVSIISEKLNNTENEGQNMKSPTAKSTPDKQKEQKRITVLEGGVEIQDVVVGKGPVATKGKMLHVFYVGRLKDKTIFDSRVPGKKPFSFKLGAEQVIKGWDIGVQGMKVGGQRKLMIPPHMGYGKKNMEGIPPNSWLYFTVELQAVS